MIYKQLKKVSFLFWGSIPLLLLYGFVNFDEVVDINIHDTMFVVPQFFVLIPLMIIFFSTGIGYHLSYYSEKFKPLNVLTILHVLLIFIGLAILFTIPQFPENGYLRDGRYDFESLRALERIRTYSIFGILLAQIIFLLNMVISLFRR